MTPAWFHDIIIGHQLWTWMIGDQLFKGYYYTDNRDGVQAFHKLIL